MRASLDATMIPLRSKERDEHQQHKPIRVNPSCPTGLTGQGLSSHLHLSIRRGKNDFIISNNRQWYGTTTIEDLRSTGINRFRSWQKESKVRWWDRRKSERHRTKRARRRGASAIICVVSVFRQVNGEYLFEASFAVPIYVHGNSTHITHLDSNAQRSDAPDPNDHASSSNTRSRTSGN